MRIAVVGLGLIGGSMALDARALTHEVYGVDADAGVLEGAKERGAIDEGFLPSGADKAISGADLTVICLYPTQAREFLERHAGSIRHGSVVTDVLGVKLGFVEEFAALCPNACYVGGHPMAGRELSGFSAAVPGLFRNCNYILTPSKKASDASIKLVEDFAISLGARRIVMADPNTHDRNIAYTSQLAHVLAAAVVSNPVLLETKGFEGGSLSDITRVARLNSALWSELFVLNASELSKAVGQLEDALKSLRLMIEAGDRAGLVEALERATSNKTAWERGKPGL